MDIQNSGGTQFSDNLPVNLVDGQFVFGNQTNAFDANLTAGSEYCVSLDSNSVTQESTVAPLINALASTYNQVNEPNAEISLSVTSSDISNNCITYGDVVFVPAITNNGNPQNQIANTIELVKNEKNVPPLPNDIDQRSTFKCVLSSDSPFLDTFLQAPNGNASAGLCETSTSQAFTEPHESHSAHAINIDANINGNNSMVANGISAGPNQIDQQQMYQIVDSNHVNIQMPSGTEQAVLLQDEHGQLYRPVQNIYVDGTQLCSNELLPIISTPIGHAPTTSYDDQVHLQTMQNSYQPNNESAPYEIPVNFISTSGSNERTSDTINTNTELQQVEFIFDSYRNGGQITDIHQSDAVGSNQFKMETHAAETNYHTQFEMQSNKEQQSLLESTMSTLLAAVNDIAAREQQLEAAREEQFQSYLNINSNSGPDRTIDYYSDTRVENASSMIYKNPPSKLPEIPSGQPAKSLSLASITNELFPNGCDSTADEYVDINEMEFIEQKNDEDQQDDNILMRRSNRRKTTKRKDNELLVVDKFVPSRARASLPTAYLYFEPSHDSDPSEENQKVLAKRQIPLQMKFGPVVGDAKQLNNHEIQKYKELNSEYPLLFLNFNCILDVSNQNTSNWMRFVRLANNYSEQNLLLYVLNSELFFECCKSISPKEELRIGYSKEYATKYNLAQFYPEPIQVAEYLCKKCDEKFVSDELLKIHQTKHKTKDSIMTVQSPVSRISAVKNCDTPLPSKSKDRLNTGAIRMRKLALSKNCRTSGPVVRYACCYCSKVFSKFLSYKKHTKLVHSVNIDHKRVTIDAEHKRLTVEDSIMKVPSEVREDENDNVADAKQLFVCQKCQRQFAVATELQEHLKTNCTIALNTQCHICLKQLQTPIGLLMHIKTHSTNSMSGIYKCPFCTQRYQNTAKFKVHVKTHMINGIYTCPHCSKEFPKYSSIRKHIKIIHTTVRFVCHECGKDFKSKYKLKEHTLSHSDVKQFSCAECDKQFKRKDKLRDHILRIHPKNSSQKNREETDQKDATNHDIKNEAHENDQANFSTDVRQDSVDEEAHDGTDLNGTSAKSKFQPKVPPTDYERFIYKCQHCMLGFKRRGMLVNHMAKRHPDIRMDSIHELNLPILKTERCFYCQYCDKVYKSSSKRKAHILKYHPGLELPQSTRCRTENCDGSTAVEPNPSFSASIGSITTHAHQCMWCYKQYASRSRLLQHKRKAHSTELEESYKQSQNDYFKDINMIIDSHESQFNNQCMDEYAMRFDEMTENVSNSVHRFHHIGYEPENRLLELSSAALEASMKDDYAFLSDNEVNAIGHDIMDTRVDVNFKCDSNTLPHLFDGFLQ